MSTQSVKMMHEEENEYYRIAEETIPGHNTFKNGMI